MTVEAAFGGFLSGLNGEVSGCYREQKRGLTTSVVGGSQVSAVTLSWDQTAVQFHHTGHHQPTD